MAGRRLKEKGRGPDSNQKDSVSTAPYQNDKDLEKPKPEFDWSFIDKFVSQDSKPINSFTFKEFLERYKYKINKGKRIFKELKESGHIIFLKVGPNGIKYYGYN